MTIKMLKISNYPYKDKLSRYFHMIKYSVQTQLGHSILYLWTMPKQFAISYYDIYTHKLGFANSL